MLLNVYLLKIGFPVRRLMGAGRHCSWSSSLLDSLMHTAQRQEAELAASRPAMSIQAELVMLHRIWMSRGHCW